MFYTQNVTSLSCELMLVFKTVVARKLTGWLTSNTRPPGSKEPQQHFFVNPARTLCGLGKHTEVLQPGAVRPGKNASTATGGSR